MSEPYELLSTEEIQKWLKGLVKKGGLEVHRAKVRENEVTMLALANYLKTSRYELCRRSVGTISRARQRLLSKVIAQIENGQLVVGRDPVTLRKTLFPVKDPKPAAPKYGVDFSGGRASLRPVERVKAPIEMPQFGSLLTKRK